MKIGKRTGRNRGHQRYIGGKRAQGTEAEISTQVGGSSAMGSSGIHKHHSVEVGAEKPRARGAYGGKKEEDYKVIERRSARPSWHNYEG